MTLTELPAAAHRASLVSLEAGARRSISTSRPASERSSKAGSNSGGGDADIAQRLPAQEPLHAVSEKETWNKPRINVARMAAVSLVSTSNF